MAYEIYKEKLNKEEYFINWDSESYQKLTNELQKQIYEKYLIKCEVFQRDNFTCQNNECIYCNNKPFSSRLTMHHIKWQKNDGLNKIRNGVTLCNGSHQAYHRTKTKLVFLNLKNLPAHIRGHTFKFRKADIINWKKVKKEMKELRKGLKNQCGLKLSWEQISILMKFLELEFNTDDD